MCTENHNVSSPAPFKRSLKDKRHSGWPREKLAHKNCYFITSSRRHRSKARQVVCLMHMEPEFVLKRQGPVVFERASKTSMY